MRDVCNLFLTEHFRLIASLSADARALKVWNGAQRWLGVVLIPSGGVYLRRAAIYTAGRNKHNSQPLLSLKKRQGGETLGSVGGSVQTPDAGFNNENALLLLNSMFRQMGFEFLGKCCR